VAVATVLTRRASPAQGRNYFGFYAHSSALPLCWGVSLDHLGTGRSGSGRQEHSRDGLQGLLTPAPAQSDRLRRQAWPLVNPSAALDGFVRFVDLTFEVGDAVVVIRIDRAVAGDCAEAGGGKRMSDGGSRREVEIWTKGVAKGHLNEKAIDSIYRPKLSLRFRPDRADPRGAPVHKPPP
jgi:hypothetical protein